MSYTFIAHQEVPKSVIKAIGIDIKEQLTKQLCQYRGMDEDWALMILKDFDIALQIIIDENSRIVDGYRLNQDSVIEIANYLKNGKRIAAIKELRHATGEGLKEAKNFIDKFQTGEQGYIEFLNAFS